MLCSCGVNNIFGAKVCKSCGSGLEAKPNASGMAQSNDFVSQAAPIAAQTQNQMIASSIIEQDAPVKSAGSELDFIPYTSNIQFEILTLLVLGIFSTTLYALASLIMTIPATAAMVRRMHDIGKSWKWLLLSIIPVVGWVVVLYWLIQPSQANENAWGPVPSES